MADQKELEIDFGDTNVGSVEAAVEFLEGEKEYVDKGLRIGFETFYNRLQVHCKLNKVIITEDEIQLLFGSYGTLYNANGNLLKSLNDLRLEGKSELVEGLGKIMLDFIPYFKLYIDYIVKKQVAFSKLIELKKGNKKFREFLKINEMCVKRKLKAFLEEPVVRLPLYLIHLNRIYEAMKRENLTGDGVTNLEKAIVDIQKVTEEIATKSKDKRARLLVGHLQEKIWKNKIALVASHRFVIHHQKLKMVQKKSAVTHHFILCNDILCISTEPSRLFPGNLVAVFPLIGVRVLKNPAIPGMAGMDNNPGSGVTTPVNSGDAAELAMEGMHRIAIIPQNKNFTPSESNAIGSVIIFFENEEDRLYWIDAIEEAVDEEEHNLRPCNPVDLEKRLRKEKCSSEGLADTITISDKVKIEEIERWKTEKERNPNKNKVRRKRSRPRARIGIKKPAPSAPPKRPSGIAGGAPSSRPGSRPATPGQNGAGGGGGPPKGRSPPPPAPSSGQRRSVIVKGSGPPPPGKAGKPPPRRVSMGPSGSSKPPPRGRQSIKRGALPTIPSKPGAKPPRPGPPGAKGGGPPSVPPAISTSMSANDAGAPGGGGAAPSAGSQTPKVAKRANLLAGIANFKRNEALKKVTERDTSKDVDKLSVQNAGPQTMEQKLQNTLERYREFVMDEDDDDDSEEDWE